MAMALGIFAGTGMDVKAADEYEIVPINIMETDLETKLKTTLLDLNSTELTLIKTVVSEFFSNNNITNKAIVFVTYNNNMDSSYPFCYICTSDLDPEGAGLTSLSTMQSLAQNLSYGDIAFYMYQKKHSTTANTSSNNTSSNNTSSTPHTHSYSWVTVQDVSSEQDGIEEYRCSCGDVQERCVIPRYMAIVKGLFGEIKNAPQNGTATFDTGRLYTISDYVIKKFAERADVTTVITFEYQNQSYKMTIPAGADFTGLLADEDYFYGYFFFANAVGATIEAL